MTFSLLRQRNFALLWSGHLISSFGDGIRFLAFSFYIYDETGSATATGAMFMVQVLPALFFGTLAGVFVDRWNRRRVMIAADSLRAVVLLPLLGVDSEHIWLLYPVAFALSFFSLFFSPASASLLPRIVARKDLMVANSLYGVSNNLARLVAPALGGALLSATGLAGVVLFDAASYVVSAVLIFLVSVPRRAAAAGPGDAEQKGDGKNGIRPSGIFGEWLDGLRLIRSRSALLVLFAIMSIALLGESVINVLFVPFVKDVLDGGALRFGWLVTARGAGGLVGGFLLASLSRHVAPHRLFALGLVGTGLLSAALFWNRSLIGALVLMFLLGLPSMAWMVSGTTLFQTWVPDRYRGRIMGTYRTLISLTTLIGSGLAGLLGDLLGALPLLLSASALFSVGGAIGLAYLRPTPPADAPEEK